MTILCGTDSTPVAALWARATREELVLPQPWALDARASLVVLGGFDSTTDRVAQACHAPLLVVRAAQPLELWLAGRQTPRPTFRSVHGGTGGSNPLCSSSESSANSTPSIRATTPCSLTTASRE